MTLDCVGIIQPSVIRIIHRNVGLKCFFYLPKFLLLSLVFAYIYMSESSVKMHLLRVEYIIITLLQIVCRVCRWKNFKNRSIIGEDKDKCKVPRFLTAHGVYVDVVKCIMQTVPKRRLLLCSRVYIVYMSLLSHEIVLCCSHGRNLTWVHLQLM